MIKGPAETLHADAGDGNGDARISSGGEVGLDTTFGETHEADAARVDVVPRFQIVDQAHDVPSGIEEERKFLAGAKRAENRSDVFGGLGCLATLGAGTVMAAVDRDADESHAGVVDEQCAFGFFVSAGAVQNNHGGTSDGR